MKTVEQIAKVYSRSDMDRPCWVLIGWVADNRWNIGEGKDWEGSDRYLQKEFSQLTFFFLKKQGHSTPS